LRELRHDQAYIARMQKMLAERDSLYSLTYEAYRNGRYAEVKAQVTAIKSQMTNEHWSLAPRFLFLNAVSVARTEGQEAFVAELQNLVDGYGETELGSMAKDMLAMMGQGRQSQTGDGTSNLAELRNQSTDSSDQTTATDSVQVWSEDRQQPSVVLLILPVADEQALNELLYEVALFNFSQFLIRDFELQKMPVFGEGCALRISGFADLDEAEWWVGLVQRNEEMQVILQNVQIRTVTEVNLPLVTN